MDFLKKLFGERKDNSQHSSQEETFTCENCKRERPLSQKKEHITHEKEQTKNVCEFC